MITRYLSLLLLALPFAAFAQFNEDFSGSFSSPHEWDGTTSYFEINAAAQLQSNGPKASSKIFLQTYSNALVQATWSFWVQMNFTSSTTNYTKIFLASSSTDLLDPQLEAYYVKVGGLSGNKDGIDLYYQKGSSQTLVAKGIEGHAGGASVTARIKVERDDKGNWEVYADTLGGTQFQLEGSGTHTAVFTPQAFGFLCIHSSTRRNGFFFDEVSIDGEVEDAQPPQLISQAYQSDSSAWLLQFDEVIDPLSVPLFTQTNHDPLPLIFFWANSSALWVKDTTNFLKEGTLLHGWLLGIRDRSGNSAPVPLSLMKPKPVAKGDVVINELLFNPFPYGQDFVELYNCSSAYVALNQLQLQNQDKENVMLDSLVLAPGSYVVLTKDSNAITEFYPRAARHTFVSCDLPAFPDDHGSVVLQDQQGAMIDHINYNQSMHNPLLENQEGVSLERTNANASSDWLANWQSASTSSGGATPGYVNSQAGASAAGGTLSIEPRSISPGTDGYRNYANIHYTLPKPGTSVRMDIFSLQGHWICSLQPSGPADMQGLCTWNGTDTNLQPVSTGLYLLVAEFSHPDGDHLKIKDTISVLLR
ncbi:MAG: hypothetical protein JWO58_847 [Chitinophagaceae bacterium]|nr:hypothetical protein [Chitinophagaceae bacterium]